MRVVELWRYPVKSMQGEQLSTAEVGPLGIVGDRHWGLVDTSTGYVLTARRVPELLLASARYVAADEVAITLPDGTETTDSGVLTSWLGRPVELRSADQHEFPRFEGMSVNDDDDPELRWAAWEGPTGVFHDSKRTQVSLASLATIGDWDRRRFRQNVIVDGSADDGREDDLVGRSVTVGSVGFDVLKRIDRCVMVTRPQPGGIERDTSVLKTINRERNSCLGIGMVVTTPGTIALGDELLG
jgi:uncharacterized protein